MATLLAFDAKTFSYFHMCKCWWCAVFPRCLGMQPETEDFCSNWRCKHRSVSGSFGLSVWVVMNFVLQKSFSAYLDQGCTCSYSSTLVDVNCQFGFAAMHSHIQQTCAAVWLLYLFLGHRCLASLNLSESLTAAASGGRTVRWTLNYLKALSKLHWVICVTSTLQHYWCSSMSLQVHGLYHQYILLVRLHCSIELISLFSCPWPCSIYCDL